MSYKGLRISEVIEQIKSQQILLPAIQRKFVWEYKQIECLFDSIMRGYPIGTFLFWKIKGQTEINKYTFYKFIQAFHERDNYKNEPATDCITNDELIGVLDGQQRLSSLYTALQGTYAYKKPRCRWDNDDAFPKRMLYMNLLKDPAQINDDNYAYEFKFLTDQDSKKYDKNQYWFKVREVLNWKETEDADDEFDKIYRSLENEEEKAYFKDVKKVITRNLRRLYDRLIMVDLISYYEVENNSLDDVLDIFIRVNDAGTPLSKTDLLFSTIIANWEEAREEVESLLITINKKGEGFRFNNDVIMKTCLCIISKPMQFKVKNFTKEVVDLIKQNWKTIKLSILKTVDMLVEFGFSNENLTSYNAIVPIAYFISRENSINIKTKEDIRKYLIISLIKQIFGSQSDNILTKIRENLEKGDFEYLMNQELPANQDFKLDHKFIEDILEYKKGPYTFMLLTLIYPHLKYGQVNFHQDHLHPASMFNDKNLQAYNIPQEKWKDWQNKKDSLPNLQLLEGLENQSKSKTSLAKWVCEINSQGEKKDRDLSDFKNKNFIDEDISLEFEYFEQFYENRKIKLKKEILSKFGLLIQVD